MFSNYLKIIFRNLSKNKLYATINLLGLALGYGSFLLVTIFLLFETSFEDFHRKSDRIFRAAYFYDSGNEYEVKWARVPINYINELPNEFPEVEHLIRFQNHERKYILVDEEKFRPEYAYQTDNEVFQVFNLELITGNAQQALVDPHSVVITESLAIKYFGRTDILGEDVMVLSDWNPEETRYEVTGVIKDLPKNTHLPIDMLFSFNKPEERAGWAYVYLLLKENTDIDHFRAKIGGFIEKYADESSRDKVHFEFQPLGEIHLHSNLAREIIPNGSVKYVYLFIGIGIFLLLIALINFTNLYSAMIIGRVKETGLRRILGAGKGQVLTYIFSESVLYHLGALVLGLVISILFFPYFQSLTDIALPSTVVWLIPFMLMLILFNALVTMVYPITILNATNPIDSIKQSSSISIRGRSGAFSVKSFLIMLQYAISVLLVGSAFIARDQFQFLNESNLGITRDQIIAIPAVPDKIRDDFQPFKDQIIAIQGVQKITACMEVPSREIRDAGPVLIKGVNTDPEIAPVMDIQVIDQDYLETLNIKLAAGNNIPAMVQETSPDFNEDYTFFDHLKEKSRTYLINETAMKQLGWQDPENAIGNEISWSISNIELGYGPIAGVVKDYHQETLKNTIDPTIMVYEPVWLRTFLIKISTDQIQETVAAIDKTWNELFPQYPMEYHFLDDMYEALYKNERVRLQLLFMLCGLAIFISFIGLFGLVAYTLKTRVKEIALRQVLGANVSNLIRLIGKEYLLLLAIASVMGIPTSYFFVEDWLQEFAYKTQISLLNYGITVLLVGSIILFTVSFQTIKTSLINPADTLREE